MHRLALTLTAALATHALAAEKNVTLTVAGATLAGTLLTPENTSTPAPVVLILPGSGPTDRDGNSAAGPAGTYRKLAAELARQGVASLRVDKRGIGRSLPQDSREDALSFDDNVNDARAWLTWLAQQPGLGPVGLLGHSEGGMVALAAAQQTPQVKALGLLATPGETMGATIRRQVTQNPANPPALVQETSRILDQLEQGQSVKTVSAVLMPLFRPSVQPYLISALKINPVSLIAQTNVPTLIVQGERDLQVRPEDARLLHAAQPKAQLVLIPDMNHVLVPAPADLPGNFRTYADATLPLAPRAVQAIKTFLKANLR